MCGHYDVQGSAHLDLRTVCDELGEVKYLWFEIGVQLGVPRYKLKEFRKEDDPLAATVDYWLCGNVEGVQVSWESVVAALNSTHVGETGLANRINRKYQHQPRDLRKITTPGIIVYYSRSKSLGLTTTLIKRAGVLIERPQSARKFFCRPHPF